MFMPILNVFTDKFYYIINFIGINKLLNIINNKLLKYIKLLK